MATFVPVAAALTLVLALGGGADAQLLDCLGGQRPTQVAELMFGRSVFNAASQWRDEATNKIVREPSKLVQIVLPGQVRDIARLNEIVAAYKTRFKQHSVVMIVRPACVSF
jgi:Protein of unknown function (DUF3574)